MSKKIQNEVDPFALDGTKASEGLNDSNDRKGDGTLKISLDDGKKGKRELTLRLVPHFKRDDDGIVTVESTILKKEVHYVYDSGEGNDRKLLGIFDCQEEVLGKKQCPLCNAYWAFHNSKNVNEQNKKNQLSKSSKYYSYAVVVDDQQVPENKDKLVIYSFGYKIHQKIKTLKEGKKNISVEDLVKGANLELILEKNGTNNSYDSTYFDNQSPAVIDGVEVELDDDGNPLKSEKRRVLEFLLERENELSDYKAKEWDETTSDRVDALINKVKFGSDEHEEGVSRKPKSSKEVFGDDDEDDAPAKPVKKKAVVEDDEDDEPAKPAKKKPTVEDDEDDKLKESRGKAKKWFDDEDEDED